MFEKTDKRYSAVFSSFLLLYDFKLHSFKMYIYDGFVSVTFRWNANVIECKILIHICYAKSFKNKNGRYECCLSSGNLCKKWL